MSAVEAQAREERGIEIERHEHFSPAAIRGLLKRYPTIKTSTGLRVTMAHLRRACDHRSEENKAIAFICSGCGDLTCACAGGCDDDLCSECWVIHQDLGFRERKSA